MGFVKKVWRETRRFVDSPAGAIVMPYTAIGSAALGSKDALNSLSTVYVQPVAGYFGGAQGAQLASAAMSSAYPTSSPLPVISPNYVEETGSGANGGGGGDGGGYFSQRGGSVAAAVPSWAWAVGAAVLGLVVVLFLRKR